LFVNNAINPIISEFSLSGWFIDNGLLLTLITNWLLLAFLGPLLEILDPLWILKEIYYCIFKCKINSSVNP